MPTAKLHTGGRRLIGQILNKAASVPTTIYVGLRCLDGASGRPSDAADGDSLTSNLNECTASGYARQAVTVNTTNITEALSGADSLLTIAQQTFNFSGANSNGGVTHCFVATSSDSSGTLIFSAPLAATRNVANGDQIKATPSLTITTG